MAMLFLFLALSIFTLFLLSRQLWSRRTRRHPPGPRGLPVIGNLHQFDIKKLHIWLTKLSTKHGPLIYLKLFRKPVIVISSADAAKKALKHNDIAFAGRPYISASSRISYDHSDIITSSYSDHWRKMRKMVSHHLFSPQKVRSFRPVREDEVCSMIADISNKANSNVAIDIGEMVSSYNCNVLCRVAFGKKLDLRTQSWKRIEDIMSQIMVMSLETFLADCVVYGWINQLSGVASRAEKICEAMDSFYQQLIDEHMDPSRPESMTDDILDLLIQLREECSDSTVKIDWHHIKAIMMNVFLAGTDTTGASLTWAMTSLIKNPKAMTKLQEEIRSLVGKKGSVDEDDVEKLPYLKAVVKETLRLYPPAPVIPKETTEASIIDGYEIEANTSVFVNIWGIGRDPEFWENANDFLPERFLNTTFDFKGQRLGFIPFGSGRRICPGASLAVATIEVALANLVYLFNWEIPDGKTKEDINIDATPGLIMYKKTPLYLFAKTYF